MTAQSIVCGTCTAAVPYGRLSCPSCGELLASVVGARRPLSALSDTSARQDVPYDAESAPLSSGIEAPELALNGGLRDPDAELPWAGAADGPAVELDHREDGIDDGDEDDDLDGFLGPDDPDEPEVDSSSTAGHAWAIAGASMTGPATPAYMPRPNHSRAAAAAAAASPVNEPPAVPPIDPPGAYVPPLPADAIPAGPPAPARAWAGYGSETDTAASAAAASNAREAEDRALDSSRVAEFIGSVSIAGAALASVGFLLPWASVMIGSSGSAYFDRWGLAGPGHVIVVIGILAILALSIVRNPIPSWIRTGLGGLGVGALLLGLTWPYLLGPLDASPGVLIDAVGAIALIGSGILALVTDRHAVVAKPV
jgi:hypothetical protein